MNDCLEAAEFLGNKLGASLIRIFVDGCDDFAKACEELGGDIVQRITLPVSTDYVAVGWSGTTIHHTCHAKPPCGVTT